jgi:hypothetical protein
MAALSSFAPSPISQANNQALTLAAQRSGAYDAVDKVRVSTPQSLIDTDFEYGQQSSKWEQVALQQNRQSCYYSTNAPLIVTQLIGNQSNKYQLALTLTSSSVTYAVGTPIFVQDPVDANAAGWGLITTASSATSYIITMQNQVFTSACFSSTSTYIYAGYFYSNCGISVNAASTTAITLSGTAITVNTVYAHGLSVGSLVYIVGTTGVTGLNAPWVVATVTAQNVFTIASTLTGTATTPGVSGNTQVCVYARPAGAVTVRAYDGSVNFTAGSSVPNAILFRQTRRYFRYQSGKGIQFSTGTILCPQIQLPVLTAVANTVTVTTKTAHNLAINTYVVVAGADQAAYNGYFQILTVPSATTFTYQTVNNVTPSVSPATSTVPNILHVSPINWYGSSNKIGFFDQQNGMFFQYDGNVLYAVLRTSVNQIPGLVAVNQGQATVTGTNTAFSSNLVVGDYIVIRGGSYRVLSISSDTSLQISPEYRGASITNAIVSRTIDTKVPQSQWYDVLDGSNSPANPSGYKLDLTKIQMWYIDYSWYGAGAVRFGVRTSNGAINYVFTFQNNNIQYTAYLRSGNMCSHYEQNNEIQTTFLKAGVGSGDTTINVDSTFGFNPAGGTAIIRAPAISGAVEYIKYTSMNATQLLGVTRGQTGGASATAFTYSATAPIAVEYAAPDTAALLSHWGSSVVMDGGFNNDASAIYNFGMTSGLTSPNSTASVPIMAIRIAPSVDNGQVGLYGLKEIVNRLQLQLREIAVVTNATYLIQLILNGVPSGFSGSFGSVAQSGTNTDSISQVAVNTTNSVTIAGGTSIAAFYSNPSGQTTYDLSYIAPTGNAALGGGSSNTVPTTQANFFPDGPDIVYVVATTPTAGGSNNILARLNWVESQA